MSLQDRAIASDGDAALWAEAQRLYEQTDTPAREIAAMLGAQPVKDLYRIAFRRGWKRHGWNRGRRHAAADDTVAGKGDAGAGRSDAACRPRAAARGRQALIGKLERTVAREIDAIDVRLRQFGGRGTGKGKDASEADAPGIDHERHARALATLARTLRELAAIDRADIAHRADLAHRDTQRADADREGDDDDDPFPRDTDALRETLARRLEQLSQDRKAG